MIKIKMLKDTEKCKAGEIVSSTKENAESTISQGYAEYLPKLTDLELTIKLKEIAKLENPIEIENKLKLLKENTEITFPTLKNS